MNYTIVKQFSNNAIDNFFNFFYKWVDFFKILLDVFLAFIDIWVTFFQIFSNAYLYVYYLILLAIDKSTQSSSSIFSWRRLPTRVAYTPSKVYIREAHNPVPRMYSAKSATAAAETVSKAAASSGKAVKDTVSATIQKFGNRPSGVKVDRMKKVLEFFAGLMSSIKRFITAPVRTVAEFIVRKMRPVRDEEPAGNKSIIDEYMREYERKRRA